MKHGFSVAPYLRFLYGYGRYEFPSGLAKEVSSRVSLEPTDLAHILFRDRLNENTTIPLSAA